MAARLNLLAWNSTLRWLRTALLLALTVPESRIRRLRGAADSHRWTTSFRYSNEATPSAGAVAAASARTRRLHASAGRRPPHSGKGRPGQALVLRQASLG